MRAWPDALEFELGVWVVIRRVRLMFGHLTHYLQAYIASEFG